MLPTQFGYEELIWNRINGVYILEQNKFRDAILLILSAVWGKLYYLCLVLRSNLWDKTCWKCFRVLIRNVAVSKSQGQTNSTHSCLDYAVRDSYTPAIPHIYSSVGYCIVLFDLGFATTSNEWNGTTPHLNRITFYIFLIIKLYIQYSL